MDDSKTTVAELKTIVKAFVDEREWGKYHNAKNLSMSIAIEAAELMELFQWIDASEIADSLNTVEGKSRLREEVSDILIYCISLANACDLNLSTAIEEKIQKNSIKYPINDYKGRYKK